MHIEVLVEEPSAEAALEVLLPRLLGDRVSFRIHVHQGKHDLLAVLPGKLRAYSRWIPDDYRIVVLADRDQDDCKTLKERLEKASADAHICSKTAAKERGMVRLVNRIAVEELESWFFGDVPALRAAFPGVSATLDQKSAFRDPDSIKGGIWERLEQVLKRAGHFKGGLGKISAARAIAEFMDPERNRSYSFQVFRDSARALARGGRE